MGRLKQLLKAQASINRQIEQSKSYLIHAVESDDYETVLHLAQFILDKQSEIKNLTSKNNL